DLTPAEPARAVDDAFAIADRRGDRFVDLGEIELHLGCPRRRALARSPRSRMPRGTGRRCTMRSRSRVAAWVAGLTVTATVLTLGCRSGSESGIQLNAVAFGTGTFVA